MTVLELVNSVIDRQTPAAVSVQVGVAYEEEVKVESGQSI